jgi:tetratricopeptide (TPR) repeat protein
MNTQTTNDKNGAGTFFTGIGRIALLAIAAATMIGCSTAPKRPPEIFTDRNAAMGQLDLANAAVSKADFVNAYLFLTEAWRLALTTDDPGTRIQILLARGNALFTEGRVEEANIQWESALAEAISSGNKPLASAARIYIARGTLAEGIAESDITKEERTARALAAKKNVEAEIGGVKANPLYTAFAWKVIGLADKELGLEKQAESALANAASIHEKGRYLEDAAYDWYLIASVRSKAGLYKEALAALDQALSFDRRAENANGLGMDWMAIGMVEEKAGDANRAAAAYRRSADIFNAAFLRASAGAAEDRLDALAEKNGSGATAQ